MKRFSRHMAMLCVATAAAQASATVVFTDDFEADHTANWDFIPSAATTGDTPNDNIGSDANVNFNYTSLVPAGPSGGSHAMKVVANLPGTGIFSGVTMMLNSQTFDFANKPYKITTDVWLNYYGGTTSGTTELAMIGVGAAAGTSQFVGDNFNSVMFSASTDGDTSTDWRAYKTPWPIDSTTGNPAVGRVQQNESQVYAANPAGTPTGTSSLNSSDPYYVAHFPGGEVPPVEQQGFANQQPNSVGMPATPGTVAFAWHRWTVTTTPNGGPISFYVSDAGGNDVLIATIQGGTTNPYTLSGDSLYVGMYDINAGSISADSPDYAQLEFALFDNLKVEDLSVTHITGDTNNDGVVDLNDLNNVLNNFGGPGPNNPGDEDHNGVVDLNDLNNVLNNFGAHAAAGALAVPEPATLSLAALGAAGLLARRRTR